MVGGRVGMVGGRDGGVGGRGREWEWVVGVWIRVGDRVGGEGGLYGEREGNRGGSLFPSPYSDP